GIVSVKDAAAPAVGAALMAVDATHAAWTPVVKADWSGYPVKATPTTADSIIIADAAASGAIKTAPLSAAASPLIPHGSIVASIAPLHWWRADNVTLATGKVSAIVDNGSSPKNLTQATAGNQATVSTNGNGNAYLNMSAAGTTFYQAGVASDWTFAHDNTGTTMAVLVERTALATANEDLFGTASGNFALKGFALQWDFT